MAVVMTMRWDGVTPQQYDHVRDLVGWEENVPEGASLHVTDVWESQAHFERFFADRLAAAIKQAGIQGEPQTGFIPMHRRFVAPGVTGGAS